MKIAVIGTGLYSTALTYQLQKKKDNDIYLWTENKSLVKDFQKTRKFTFLSKSIKFDSNVVVSESMDIVLSDASVIFILVGSKYFVSTLSSMKPFYKKNTPILVGTKGMNLETGEFYSDITRRILKCHSYNFFAGPTFAKDLIFPYPSSLTFAGTNKIAYKKFERIFPNSIKYEFIYDLYGLEICAVLKNIYAIGSGILTGLKVPNTVYYSFMTDMISEISVIIEKCYGEKETLARYGGIGDLLMTTGNKTSRNFSYGKLIGAGKSKEELEEFQKSNTIEGLESLKCISKFLKKYRIRNSKLNLIYQIVVEEENPTILYELEKQNEEF